MRASRRTLGAWSVAMLLFLWAPLLVIVVYSFNAARFGAGWRGFTLEWYRALWSNEAALSAAKNTLVLAGFSTLVSTVLGTALGYSMGKRGLPGGRWTESLIRLPVVIPDVVLAVALLLWFGALQPLSSLFEPGMTAMVVGHVTFQIPFVALVVRARTLGLDPALEEAASDLGATPARVFWGVTLPLLRPAVIVGALLAFTLSLDDFAVSFFTSGPGSTTLPVLIYATARRGVTPDIHALATLLVVATVGTVLAVRWVQSQRGDPVGLPEGARVPE